MHATLNRNENKSNCLAVSAESLAEMLDCGRSTAVKIGTEAGARFCIGRRVLFKVDLIEKYINNQLKQGMND